MTATQSDAHHSSGYGAITVAMGIGFALIWSSAFTFAKFALQYAPPLLMLSGRFMVAGLIAVAIAAALGNRLPRGRDPWMRITVLGICQNVLYLGLMFVAMTSIEAGLGAIIGSALPLVVAALAPAFLHERIGPIKMTGLALGFLGVIWVMQNHLGDAPSGALGTTAGILFAAVGTIALGVGTVVVKHGSFGTGIMMVVGLQMLVGGIVLAPLGLALESFSDFDITWQFVAAISYIIVGPSLLATWLWFTLLQRTSATEAGAYHFLNPVFGVAVAWLVLGEQFGWSDWIGIGLVAAGILVVNRGGRRPPS
ncbi:MAG: DMT family transporter [Pseudomonadota bacterium]